MPLNIHHLRDVLGAHWSDPAANGGGVHDGPQLGP
jgi:hypothetical protein